MISKKLKPPAHGNGPIRLAIVLPGLGRVRRGAETAFGELAVRLARQPDFHVTTFGLGPVDMPGPDHIALGGPGRERFEHWPKLPALRNAMAWEELCFAARLRACGQFRPAQFDLVMGCSYPWVNWCVQSRLLGPRPKFVHVTLNGDWPVRHRHREYRYFHCDGLVCVTPEHLARSGGRFPAKVIGNGVDTAKFHPAHEFEDALHDTRYDQLPGRVGGSALPPRGDSRKILLVSSALTPEKRVDAAIRATARLETAFLAIAGDGPLRHELLALAQQLIPGRFALLGSVPTDLMPALYRRADALLHCNADEPFGIVYLEAAASGLAIVAPDVPTARWIMADTALYYADPDNSIAVADRIAEALRIPPGRGLRAEARKRAASEWSWDQKAAEYAVFLHQLHSRTEQFAAAGQN